MRQKNKPKRRSPRSVLHLPDLDHSKSSVLQSLGSVVSQRTYGFAIDDFISWYCSEPRLAFGLGSRQRLVQAVNDHLGIEPPDG
jgi:hypothetical protein